jgi:hypothetical protein
MRDGRTDNEDEDDDDYDAVRLLHALWLISGLRSFTSVAARFDANLIRRFYVSLEFA